LLFEAKPNLKVNTAKKGWGMVQVVESLRGKCETMSSNSDTAKKRDMLLKKEYCQEILVEHNEQERLRDSF
jgi:hypothetical protein